MTFAESRRASRAAASPLVWSLYLVLPVAGWGWLSGVPLAPLSAAAPAVVWWVWSATKELPGRRRMALLVVVKLLLGALILEHGFEARYYANSTRTPPVEHVTAFHGGDVTRVDHRLAFGGDGQPDLPLHFLNDLRFNFHRSDQPDRAQLPYSVVWDGYVRTSSDRPMFYVVGDPQMSLSLEIDGKEVLTLGNGTIRTASVPVYSGWLRARVVLLAPYESGRRVEAGEIVNGERRPFGGPGLLRHPAGLIRRSLDVSARWAASAIDLIVFGWIVVLGIGRVRKDWRERRIGHLIWLAVIADALLFALPRAGRAPMLTGGDDWLTYEHLSRAIIGGDPLLREPGLSPGQGSPFYYQPLYPYFLSLTHLLFGDGFFGMAFVQRLLVGACAGWIALTTTTLFGTRAGWIAAVWGGLAIYIMAGRWAGVPLADPLFMPLLAWWVWLLVKSASDASLRSVVHAGLVGGVATLVRSTLLLAWPLVMPAWVIARRARRVRALTVLVAVCLGVVGVATVRNWVVSGQFVPVSTTFGINLLLGNQPAAPLDPAPQDRVSLYDRLGIETNTRTVAEYAMQRPGAFVDNLTAKALYSLGFFKASGLRAAYSRGQMELAGLKEAPATSWLYVGLWAAALAGIGRILVSRAASPGWLLPLFGAVGHLAAVVLIFPNIYTDRLILPLYPLLVPYAAAAIAPLTSRAHHL